MRQDTINHSQKYHLGFDLGSISLNTVLMDEDRNIVENRYTYCEGRPFYVLKNILEDIINQYGAGQIGSIALTGSGGKKAAELIGGSFINEIIAQSTSASELYPEAKTIIEMGGEDSKLILMENGKENGHSRLADFALNSLCAAGTGSFLDQQAKRIGVSIENEFGNLALLSENPPRIAGRCSVFAKSDMIHLQQIATPLHDIVAGLCFAVARNFKSNLGRGKKFKAPFLFQGGVAANAGMVRAFREIFELKDDELIIPEYHASMGAIGALFHVLSNGRDATPAFKGVGDLNNYLQNREYENIAHEPLVVSAAIYNKEVRVHKIPGQKIKVALGVDIGSLSTNVVLIDAEHNVVARRYLPTASKPLNAVQRGLKEIFEEIGSEVEVVAAGTTGSGRYLIGDFIGADLIRNEITAQATAAIDHDPTVDTIFEIGGQDSKYISIQDGVIVDFEMNKVCAAGTGSFLEEQAEKLNINIINEFEELALAAKNPVRLGDRCTVFMESDLNSHQQRGADKDNLVGGLAYSIVQNYIQKVVGDKPVGNKIFFQGGVTNNKSVVAAFEKITGKPIIIPPHFDVTGAIGAAILAQKSMAEGQPSRFKGFHISELPFSIDSFTCKSCTNHCEIQKVKVAGEKKALFYGGRCEMYEVDDRKGKGKDIPNYFEERLKYLVGDFEEKPADGRITIGIPHALMVFWQQFPFWRTFFNELDFRIVLSDPTDYQLTKKSLEIMVAETCFPVEIIHGHVENLLQKNVDFVFLPFIVNAKGAKTNPTNNPNCPWIQTYPFMLRSAFTDPKTRDKFLTPTLHFRYFGKVLNNEISSFMKEKFGIAKSKTLKAILRADDQQTMFETVLRSRGRSILDNLPSDKKAMVILGRPYNTGDPALNLRLVEKLINLNTIPIPLDFLPLQEENIFDDYRMMYWPNGQKILAASRLIRKNKNLFGVYLGNFRCGPDSFITHYVREEMKGKPYLHLEVDEHSADAGLVTRLEAFLDSLEGYLKVQGANALPSKFDHSQVNKLEGRTLYFPYARDTVHAMAAASRLCGIKAEVLPMPGPYEIEIARKQTNGQECFPFIATLGSFLKKLKEPGADPSKMTFFMPDHNGPCRFGDYNKLHRIIFDRLGFYEAEILTPTNDNSYAEIAPGKSAKFRLNAWKGIVATDLLKKMVQEKRPYEKVKGSAETLYQYWLQKVIESVETGSGTLPGTLEQAGKAFSKLEVVEGKRKPVIVIVGETFMRDNPYCSSYLVEKLEALGAETIMAPFGEWLIYSSYRYERDSIWKGDIKGLFKAKIQQWGQHYTGNKLKNSVKNFVEMEREIELEEMMEKSAPYIHKDYDGDPIAAFGTAGGLVKTNISGVIYIMPFTCMPGTLVASASNEFRRNNNNIPWENIAYDGQESTNIDSRLQAFMHQCKLYAKANNFSQERVMTV
ncbi:MAG: acyl-CoA dehydratase activase [Bacteroidales bacterium]